MREIADGVALLKDMAEALCLCGGSAGSGCFDLVRTGFSIPSSPSLFLICVNVGCYFTQSTQTRRLVTTPQGSMDAIVHLLSSIP